MKNNFNYSGFCKSAYSFNSKKSEYLVIGKRENNHQDNPAWRVPPYLALPPASGYVKGSQ